MAATVEAQQRRSRISSEQLITGSNQARAPYSPASSIAHAVVMDAQLN